MQACTLHLAGALLSRFLQGLPKVLGKMAPFAIDSYRFPMRVIIALSW
jgi:hypothetical protein